jgi:hypothetical protein
MYGFVIISVKTRARLQGTCAAYVHTHISKGCTQFTEKKYSYRVPEMHSRPSGTTCVQAHMLV